MSNDRNYGILGFLTGAAVGAALGILFAPRSGRETRERIVDRMGSAKDDLDDLIESGRAEWSRAKGKASDAASMTKDEVNDFIRFLFEEGRDLKERLRRDVTDTADEVKARAGRAAENVRPGAN